MRHLNRFRQESIVIRALFLAAPLLICTACANVSQTAPPGTHIGEPLQAVEIETLSTVQSEPADHFNKTLLVEAEVVAVCQMKGCWMQVRYDDHKAMVRWEEGCDGKYAFPMDSIGERVLIQASFYEKVIDPADIEHMESESATPLDIPEEGYELNASAVVMLDRRE